MFNDILIRYDGRLTESGFPMQIRLKYTALPSVALSILLLIFLLMEAHGVLDDPRLTVYRGHDRTDYDHYCTKYRSECSRNIGHYADGSCAYTPVEDGAACGWIRNSVCAKECTCHAGKAVMIAYTCDDGNPCTRDSCRYVGQCTFDSGAIRPQGLSDSQECRNTQLRNGSPCHPDDPDAMCVQGLCVQRVSGTIYTTDPVMMKLIRAGDPED